MRKTGRTTRAIDLAIQKLFELGSIEVPLAISPQERYRKERGLTVRQIESFMYDPDSHIGPNVQRDLFKNIIKRLKTEHQGLELIISYNKQIIELL